MNHDVERTSGDVAEGTGGAPTEPERGFGVGERLHVIAAVTKLGSKELARALQVDWTRFQNYFYGRAQETARAILSERLRELVRHRLGCERDDLLTADCADETAFRALLKERTPFPHGDYFRELDNSAMRQLPREFYAEPLRKASDYVEGRLPDSRTSRYPRIIVAPPNSGKRLFLKHWLLDPDARPSMPVCHFDALLHPDINLLTDRIAEVLDPANKQTTPLDRIRRATAKYRLLLVIENFGTYFEYFGQVQKPALRAHDPRVEFLFHAIYQDGAAAARLLVTSADHLHIFPLWEPSCAIALPKVDGDLLADITGDWPDSRAETEKTRALIKQAADAGLGPLGATRRILLRRDLRSGESISSVVAADSSIPAIVQAMEPTLLALTRIVATSEDGLRKETLSNVLSDFFGRRPSEVDVLVETGLERIAKLLAQRNERTVDGREEPSYCIDPEAERQAILRAWESGSELDRRDARRAHRKIGLVALAQGDRLKGEGSRRIDTIERWVQAARHLLASTDTKEPNAGDFDRQDLVNRIVSADRRVSAREGVHFVFHEIYRHRLEGDEDRGRGHRKYRMVRKFVHGPTQTATRGRLKSPPEADRKRHPRPGEIATRGR